LKERRELAVPFVGSIEHGSHGEPDPDARDDVVETRVHGDSNHNVNDDRGAPWRSLILRRRLRRSPAAEHACVA
jgi:hypothetical protein